MRLSFVKKLQALTYRTQSVYMTTKAQSTTYPLPYRTILQTENAIKGKNTRVFAREQNYQPVWKHQQQLLPSLQQQIELYKHQNYSYRILHDKHRQQALELLAEAFDQKQPITASFNRKHPELKGGLVENWASYWDFFIDELIGSEMSVAVFDTDHSDEMVGIVVAKDYRVLPEGYEQKFMSDFNVVSQMMGLANYMLDKLDFAHQQILTQKAVVDLFGGTIKEKHVGKRLFCKILELNVALGKSKGYGYAFTYVTNFKSQQSLNKLQFEKVGDYDCSQYVQDGRRPFALVEQLHKKPSIWLKLLA